MTGKPRVLAVDDDPDLLQIMRRALEGAYEMAFASDGAQGLDLALASPPDLILTDVDMPGMTGGEMLRRLRQTPAMDDVPVIVVTGHHDGQLRVDLLRSGAQDFLSKPFSIEELRVRVANLMRVRLARELLQGELHSRERDIGALVAEVASRRVALEAALETATGALAQAERANQAKTTFLSLVSHELRTPLTVLRLTVDRWRRAQEVADGADASAVKRVDAALRRLNAIVDSVIDYTTVQSNGIEPRPELTDLVPLIAGLREELDARIAARGLCLEVEVAEDARQVVVDPRILRLILSNLLDNAIKHTDRGSLWLRAFVAGIAGDLVLTMRDSGHGIDPLDCERIFEPFELGVRIEHKSTPGFGLGLAVVRDLTALLGGSVTVASEMGVGSTFTVTLPGARSLPSGQAA